MTTPPPPLSPELVQDFVAKAHGDLNAVFELLEREPALANAAWDWGGGAMLTALPQLREARGPHGIPLLEHAKAGGEQAREVVQLLEHRAAALAE
jgi:hypothetical protein